VTVHRSVLDAVGGTPLIQLNRITAGIAAAVHVKVEFANPGGSVKDRAALAMVREAERLGHLQPGGVIVEGSSGNTGVGLAMVAAQHGHRAIVVVPDTIAREKVALLRAYGAQVVQTVGKLPREHPEHVNNLARRIAAETPGGWHANQYDNPANPRVHELTTGPEIWEQTDGKVTHVVAGMGTGGTITGIGQYLHKASKGRKSPVQVVGIDTVGSIFTEYFRSGKFPADIHQYLVEGIGEDFLPGALAWDAVDDVVQVPDEDAFLAMAQLVREEGIFAGSSSGAAVAGALKVARKLPKSALVVVVLPDAGEKYISKFNLEWMEANGLTKAPEYLRKSAAARAGKPAPGPRGKKVAIAKVA
jgi:cystathionine beta-synthase